MNREEYAIEKLIHRIFQLIDGQIQSSIKNNEPFPFYDMNELIKLEYQECPTPLRLSIKFKNRIPKYGIECDISGNHIALLWLYKNRKRLTHQNGSTMDPILKIQIELFGLWEENYEELEEIPIQRIESLDAYILDTMTNEVLPINF